MGRGKTSWRAAAKGAKTVGQLQKKAGRRVGFQMGLALAAGRSWRGIGVGKGRSKAARKAAGGRRGGRRGR